MYKEFFGLKELPFSIAPDPRYLYMSRQHQEALAHLIYGLNSDGGFVLLTGEVGTGKTTVCRCLLEQVPQNTDIAFILNPKVTVEELLAAVCDELGIKYPHGNRSIKVFVDHINAYLLDAFASGRKTVLIIEEAQNLGADVLEQVRLLTNLETNQRKLLQIIMLGQPELRAMLQRPEMRQLDQRITARYHLGTLSTDEIASYVTHRLAIAGTHTRLFHETTIKKLFKLSRGVPRLINVLCDRALLGAYVNGQERVDRKTLTKAAQEVFGKKGRRPWPEYILRWALAGLLIIVSVTALMAFYSRSGPVSKQKGVYSPLNWTSNIPMAQSSELAYRSLLEQWGVKYKPDGGGACDQAGAYGLGCLDMSGGLEDLRRLNRPAVLKLFDSEGNKYSATLTALSGQTATVIIGNEPRQVELRELEMRWLGSYSLLWRIPPDYKGAVQPGDKDKIVMWLRSKIALVSGKPVTGGMNAVYDSLLAGKVKKFQFSKGVVPDGMVGPQTIIHLNAISPDHNEPVLNARQEGW